MTTSAPGFERLRDAQMAAVGRAFVRARPRIVAPVALAQMVLLATSDAPTVQRVVLGAAVALFVVVFVAEARMAATLPVTRRWLGWSLGLTTAGLGLGALLSGGLASPLLPLVLAPIVVAFAAFGRRRETLALSLAVVGLTLILALLPRAWPFAPIAEPSAGWMRLAAFAGTTALAWVGVAALTDAHDALGRRLDGMRLATLQEAAARLRATEQVAARVAHELKNPLAAQKALLQLVLRTSLDERTLQRLQVAYSETERMETLARDYLAFVKPLVDLHIGSVAPRQICEEVVAVLEARAAASGVALAVRAPAGGADASEPPSIEADARRLREALLNLADNAITATPRGGFVTLAVARGDHGGAVVTIDDSGPGMPPEVLAAPGTPFVTTRPEGTGLGLTLARAAIEQHGGRLRFESTPGRGTRATIELPARAPASAETA